MMRTNAFGHAIVSCFKRTRMQLFSRAKTVDWIAAIAFVGMSAGVTAVYLWRCQFGVDLTDEAFYLAAPWKLFGLGDKPFTHEIYNGVRHSDFLNYLFVRPLVGFSVLKLRWAAVFFYSMILAWYTVLNFNRRVGWVAGFAFTGCLTFDYFLMPTWSYNWWVRNFLLVHHGMLILAARAKTPAVKVRYLAGAGASMAVMIIAYNSLLPALPLTALGLGLLNRKYKKQTGLSTLALVLPYLLAATILIGLDLIYCLGVGQDWILSTKAMSSMTEYSPGFVVNKVTNIFGYLFSRAELYLLLLVLIEVPVLKKKGPPWLAQARWVVSIPCLAWIVFKVWRARDVGGTMDTLVSVGFCAAVVLTINAWFGRKPFVLVLVLSSLLITFGVAISSTNQWLALFWGMPSLVILFVAEQTKEMDALRARHNAEDLIRPFAKQLVLRLFLLLVVYGAYEFQRTTTYYDVPPGNCLTTLKMAPLAGLKTSERRAFLTEELYRLVADKQFVLSFADIPGPFYFGKARPSADTVIVEAEAPVELHKRSLQRMWERKRIPEIIIRAKVHPWYWGIEHPFSKMAMYYPVGDPYTKFSNCVRTKTVVSYEEFEAYEVDASRVEYCVKESTG